MHIPVQNNLQKRIFAAGSLMFASCITRVFLYFANCYVELSMVVNTESPRPPFLSDIG